MRHCRRGSSEASRRACLALWKIANEARRRDGRFNYNLLIYLPEADSRSLNEPASIEYHT